MNPPRRVLVQILAMIPQSKRRQIGARTRNLYGGTRKEGKNTWPVTHTRSVVNNRDGQSGACYRKTEIRNLL